MLKKLIALGTIASSATALLIACGGDDTEPDAPAIIGDAPDMEMGAGGGGNEVMEPEVEDTTNCGGEISGGDVEISPLCTNDAPPNCNISSFEPDTFNAVDDTWGDEMSLTGGTFVYGDPITYSLEGGAFVVTGEVLEHAGWGFWFGPCVDASHFDGLEFTISGDLGGEEGELEVQIQTDENYPIGDDKGACEWESLVPEAEMWNVCGNNKWIAGGFPFVDAYTFRIPFSEFIGGTPVATLSPNQLLGVQFQLNCGEDPAVMCFPNLQIHDLRFYKGFPEALGPEPVAEETTEEAPAEAPME